MGTPMATGGTHSPHSRHHHHGGKVPAPLAPLSGGSPNAARRHPVPASGFS
eukprot:gene31879-31032_t